MPRRQVQNRANWFKQPGLASPDDDLLRPRANLQTRSARRGRVMPPVNDVNKTAGADDAGRFAQQAHRFLRVQDIEQQGRVL